jgi:pimeloyl-ACP methyl ester carboxylesterase
VEALDTFWKQMIPDLNSGLPSPNPSFANLADLSKKLDGAILMGHSQSGTFPLEAALINPDDARGLIVIEPGACDRNGFTAEQIETLAGIPILVVFGDYLDAGDGFWQTAFEDCNAFVERVNGADGNATMLYPPELGIFGNSHMLMQDRNNLQIADLILDWIADEVGGRSH